MTEIPWDWAESIHVDALSADLETGLVMRLARYPAQGLAWLWVNAFAGGVVYGYNDDTIPLNGFMGVTDVDADAAVFELTGNPSARFARTGLITPPLIGVADVDVLAHRSAHAERGNGDIPLRLHAEFRAGHHPENVRAGRLEVMGHVDGWVEVGGVRSELSRPGKWHQQVGRRPRFGMPFTYMDLCGESFSLLASTRATGAWGFLHRGSDAIPVTGMTIDPPGDRRHFSVTLGDGTTIEGDVTVRHAFSVAIEDRRRPGTAVFATTTLGETVGLVNDWEPNAEFQSAGPKA